MRKGDGFEKLPTNPAIEALKQDIRDDERQANTYWLIGKLLGWLAVALLVLGGLKGFANLPIRRNDPLIRLFTAIKDLARYILELPNQLSPEIWPAIVRLVPYPDFAKSGLGPMQPLSLEQYIETFAWGTWAIGLIFLGHALVNHSARLRKAAQEMRAIMKPALVNLAIQGNPLPTVTATGDTVIVNMRNAYRQILQSEVKSSWWYLPTGMIAIGFLGDFLSTSIAKLIGLS